jgi:hypothetical protein
MKKMKKILALALSGVMVATLAVLTPITSRAEGKTISHDVEWHDYDTDGVFATTTIVVTLQEDRYYDDGEYYEYDEECFFWYAGRKMYDEGLYWYWVGALNLDGYYFEGDTVQINLPFVLDEEKAVYGMVDEYFEVVDYSASKVILECVEPYGYDSFFRVLGDFDMPTPAPQNEFWLEPMKTQLAIAAEVAAANGSAVAEASGDFGLSYEIMKWLEDHPGVTLNYTLTYNGEEHLIVIQGGQKLANPEIPWYGPEYLIGYFGK